jgi:branched-chain amino acid transport system permease protein
VVGLAAIVAIGLPLSSAVSTAQRFLLAYVVIVCLLAVALHLIMGLAGLFSLGQATTFGLGAYAAAVLTDRLGLDAAVAYPLVGLVGAGVGAAMALATLRSSDLYLALATLSFGFVAETLIRNVDAVGGAQGMTGLDVRLLGASFDDPLLIYWTGLGLLVVACAVITTMRHSKHGRALMAARESPVAAEGSGVSTKAYRFLAFCVSGAIASLAGALYVAYAYVVDTSVFDLGLTIAVLTIVIVGGLRSLPGVLVAAVALTVFRARAEEFGFGEYVILGYGLTVILALLFLPDGLGGLLGRMVRGIGRRSGLGQGGAHGD